VYAVSVAGSQLICFASLTHHVLPAWHAARQLGKNIKLLLTTA
jgi:hypothetical protein